MLERDDEKMREMEVAVVLGGVRLGSPCPICGEAGGFHDRAKHDSAQREVAYALLGS